MFPFYNHYPGTDLHEIDLAYLLKLAANLEANNKILMAWKAEHEEEYQDLLDKVNGLIENLVDVIVPWDSSIAYHIFSIVEYQGTNYIAVQDVPVGVMITNTDYWQPANTVVEQINAISLIVSDLQDEVEAIPETVYPRRAYFRPEDYGAVVNDSAVNNSPFIEQAIIDAMENHGIVLLSEGSYHCSTPINIIERAMCIRMIGTGGRTPVGSTYGSVIEYSGTGYALHFSNGSWGCEFKDFSIKCTAAGGSCLKFSRDYDISSETRSTHLLLENLNLYFRENGLNIANGAYVLIENCNIHYINNTFDIGRRGVIIGDPNLAGNETEYLTIMNSQIVCGTVSDASILPNFDSIGLWLRKGTHINIYNLDVTFSDVGFFIDPSNDIWFLKSESLDIASCHYGLYIKIDGKVVGNSIITMLTYTPPTPTSAGDRAIKGVKLSGGAPINARIKIKSVVVRAGTATMDYLAESDDGVFAGGDSEITFSMSQLPKLNMGNNYRTDLTHSTLSNLSSVSSDVNDFKSAGLVQVPFSAAAVNGPGFACLIENYGTPAYIIQLAIPTASSGSLAFRIYNITNDIWGSWQTLAKQ